MLTYLLWTKLIKLVLLPLQPTNSPDPDNQSGYAIVIARSDTFKKYCLCLTTDTEYTLVI